MPSRGFLDNSEIDVTCPNGHTIHVAVGVLRRSPTFTCPNCDATIEVDGSDLDRGMRKVDRAFDDLQKTLKKLGR